MCRGGRGEGEGGGKRVWRGGKGGGYAGIGVLGEPPFLDWSCFVHTEIFRTVLALEKVLLTFNPRVHGSTLAFGGNTKVNILLGIKVNILLGIQVNNLLGIKVNILLGIKVNILPGN